MDRIDLPDVMRAIAARLRATIPGLYQDSFGGVQYPAPNSIPGSPYIVILDGAQAGPTTVRRTLDGHEVQGRITVRILVKTQKDRPREASRIDALITPVLDALDPVIHGGSANHVLPTLDGHIDRVWDDATVIRGSTEEYAGEFCYAADIGLDPFFTRTPQEIAP